jgi:hypothetical protein
VIAHRIALFRIVAACTCVLMARTPVAAQIVETIGSRALGMGGAFVAVANDSSATWWNPAGLADGPFLDLALSRAVTQVLTPEGRRDRGLGLALGTPPFGFAYYRLRFTQLHAADHTAQPRADRQDRRAEHADSLDVSQFGATFIQTLIPGIHAATTVKYLRGTARHDTPGAGVPAQDPDDWLDRGDGLTGGEAQGRFDFDVGVLAVTGPLRLGAVARNVRQVEFGDLRLPRQIRVGAAFDAEAFRRLPLTVALDADIRAYDTGNGRRRVVAVGAERWFRTRQVGIRGGARFNTVGSQEHAITAGVSASPRPGLFVDAHAVGGGATEERGWGVAARVSF